MVQTHSLSPEIHANDFSTTAMLTFMVLLLCLFHFVCLDLALFIVLVFIWIFFYVWTATETNNIAINLPKKD